MVMAHDVFISYSSKDRTVTHAVVSALENENIRCWYAPRDIQPGADWGESITEAIDDCKIFLLIFSKNSNQSKRVLDEVYCAISEEKTIIPFRIENLDPTGAMRLHLSSKHWLDAYHPSWSSHLNRLSNSLKMNLEREVTFEDEMEESHQFPHAMEQAPAKKRWPLATWAMALLGFAAVVIVGGVGWFALSQPRATPTPSESPSTEVAIVSEPPETSIPVTPTIAPTEIPSNVFRDDFDNSLAEGWNILREVSTHWSLTDKPGSWRVTLIPGTFDGFIPELPTNVLLREAPKDDFEIATLVHFTPTSNYQFAGLFVYQDDQNVVQLGRSYCDRPDACVGNGIYFDSIGNVIDSIATVTTNPSLAYLRLRREGTTYTGYYSEDGENWTIIGQHISNINPVQVGLMAGQALEVETTADFEYFTMEELPSISSVLSEWRTLSSIFRMRISSVSRKAAVLPSQIQIPILLRDLMKSLKVISS
jgi:regulation of enolase protein 1 (concanavalin A-like superfamily)